MAQTAIYVRVSNKGMQDSRETAYKNMIEKDKLLKVSVEQ